MLTTLAFWFQKMMSPWSRLRVCVLTRGASRKAIKIATINGASLVVRTRSISKHHLDIIWIL